MTESDLNYCSGKCEETKKKGICEYLSVSASELPLTPKNAICAYCLVAGHTRGCDVGMGCTQHTGLTGSGAAVAEQKSRIKSVVLPGSAKYAGVRKHRKPPVNRILDPDKLRKLWEEDKTDQQIAEACGVSRSSVYAYRRRHGLESRHSQGWHPQGWRKKGEGHGLSNRPGAQD